MSVLLRHARRASSQGAGSTGFTLVELLVAVAIGGLVLSGAVIILISHIRASTRLAALQHLQDHCGWVQFLINREIEQAERARAVANGMELIVPGMDSAITYVHDAPSRELRRSGPVINAQGRLDAGLPPRVQDLVARDVEDFTVDVANERAPRYSLTMSDATGARYTINQHPQDPGNLGGAAYCRARDMDIIPDTPPAQP